MSGYGFYFGEPLWLAAIVVPAAMIWLARHSLRGLSPGRRRMAVILRCLGTLLLIAALARLTVTQRSDEVAVVAVLDRSLSIPPRLADSMLDWLEIAVGQRAGTDQFAVVDVAEFAAVTKLPVADSEFGRRNTLLEGYGSRLAHGLQMAMAIAPPGSATRIMLASDGNQTSGDLREAARIAAANGIPIDVLPLRYNHEHEVVMRSLAAPARARSGATLPLRFVLESTGEARGRLELSVNGKIVDLSPGSEHMSAAVRLERGVNVWPISLPVGMRGLHDFKAVFIPEDASHDRIWQNNIATAMTYVDGEGHVVLMDADGESGRALAQMLRGTGIDVRYMSVREMPDMARLIDADAVALVNVSSSEITIDQQEQLVTYVRELGGGFAMIGGPQSFGAGGWIDSPLAEIVPLDMDPPQKKQMPAGALVLVLDRSGSMGGEKIEMSKAAAAAAVKMLSQEDLVGVIAFDGVSEWKWKLSEASDKSAIYAKIREIGAGGGTVMGPAMDMAYKSLKGIKSGVRHVIALTDGHTSDPQVSGATALEMAAAGITVSTVAVGQGADADLLQKIAAMTGGRFYQIDNPSAIPAIFIKEAQVVRRALIVERPFVPASTNTMSEILRGLTAFPELDGYVLTGERGGLSQVLLASDDGDPILASMHAGLGRSVAFTSSADGRWASNWLAWPGAASFWEQTLRWAAKPAQARDAEVSANFEGDRIGIVIEAADEAGQAMRFSAIEAQVFGPDNRRETIPLVQTGPGQYMGSHKVEIAGSYIVNLQYRKPGQEQVQMVQTPIVVPSSPEFRDVTDNSVLLEELAAITGGRVLPADASVALLFDRKGLKLPQTQMPLTRWLMMAWLVVFLSDVAVRRVAVDWRAARRRLITILPGRTKDMGRDENLERLKAVRRKAAGDLAAKSVARKRYEAKAQWEGHLPKAQIKQENVASQPEAQKEPIRQAAVEHGHIDQLLRAKRRVGGKDETKE